MKIPKELGAAQMKYYNEFSKWEGELYQIVAERAECTEQDAQDICFIYDLDDYFQAGLSAHEAADKILN